MCGSNERVHEVRAGLGLVSWSLFVELLSASLQRLKSGHVGFELCLGSGTRLWHGLDVPGNMALRIESRRTQASTRAVYCCMAQPHRVEVTLSS